MEELYAVQENNLLVMKKTISNFKKSPKDRLTKSYIKVRLDSLEKDWCEIYEVNKNIIRHSTVKERKEHEYFSNDLFEVSREQYLTCKSDMLDLLENIELHKGSISSCDNNSKFQDVRLPKINIPIFKGDYNEWLTFKDLYTSLIHNNNSLSCVQKLHYLKTSVSGEPEQILKHIQVSDNNYEIAWKTLTQRYNNRRIIVNSILSRLFGQKKLNSESSKGIRELLDTTTECLNNLKNNNINTDNWDPLIIYLTVNKLDQNSHKLWEEEIQGVPVEELPKLERLNSFLEARFRVTEMIQSSSYKDKTTIRSKVFYTTAENVNNTIICSYCKKNHYITNCMDFSDLSPDKRTEYVQNENLCFNCLKAGHNVKFCRVRISCKICKKKHNTLIHIERENENKNFQNEEGLNKDISSKEVHHILSHVSTHSGVTLLATALVNIETSKGPQVVRALIDPCSQESFITETTVKKLQLNHREVEGKVVGVGQMSTLIEHAAEIKISSRFNKTFVSNCTAYVIGQVTYIIPVVPISNKKWSHLNGLQLADPTYNSPGKVDLLLGVNVYTQILMNGIIKGEQGDPIAQQTHLGWIISGGSSRDERHNRGIVSIHLRVSLDEMMQKFWDCEHFQTNNTNIFTSEEKRAEEVYEKTVSRDESGRYIVSLPFIRDEPVLHQNSKEIAMKRLMSLEKRLFTNKKLKNDYDAVLKEYLELNHMELVTDEEKDNNVYLPHHAVVKYDRETTKLRIVFDASCPGTNGVSLNDELIVGPHLQEELRDIFIRWRQHKICFVADIVKMYRQIRLRKNDTNYQCILYRFDANKKVESYKLLTVTFGTSSAPYLAIKTLRQVAIDEGNGYPMATKIVNKDFYIDDVLSGFDEEKFAVEAGKQLTELLKKGGFELQKWCSNSQTFMSTVEPEKRASNTELEFNSKDYIKTLGILWHPREDSLKISQRFLQKDSNLDLLTKRVVLRQIASLFDPMGWLAPVIICAKNFMQKLWLKQLDWDEELTDDLKEEWKKYKNLHAIEQIKIDRWTGYTTNTTIELHGFSDASQEGYAAVVYTRVLDDDKATCKMSIIMSKTKVAPVKQISLPRLELCAATLLSKLLKHIGEVLNIHQDNIYAWSDSKVVLAWIKGDPNRWTPFVKNRVIEIRNNSNAKWLYINTKENPADPASRGLLPNKLKECDLSWSGQEFLRCSHFTTPQTSIPETELERKIVNKCASTTVKSTDIDDKISLLKRFSKLNKLLNVISFCRRWLNVVKKKRNDLKFITNIERQEALIVCIKMAQEIDFEEEIKTMKCKENIKRGSKLLPLHPFLDVDNVLRVGGRLKHAEITHDLKHPILLRKDNPLTLLLIDDAHKATLHGGPQLMTAYLRNKFWVINGGQTIKRFYRNCTKCAIYNATPSNQLMGDLPSVRVKPSRLFNISGVDFAGPVMCRLNKGRGTKAFKAYICLFVCMSTKAIHIELVSDMTTEAFVAAFKRFVARRGSCKELWSDHGTTFIAAEKSLLQMWRQGNDELPEDLRVLLDQRGTSWKYIPPGAPNFGGLWEAGVKSVKYHLKRIIGETTLTFEELYTALTQIEACLNSRPLTPLNDEFEYLTPGHFLIRESTLTVPEGNQNFAYVNNLTRWRFMQKILRDFRSRWQSEYLARLQQRPKWMRIQKDFEVGELVLIKDFNKLPPSCWHLGRIERKYTGQDNLTRMYDIRTPNGTIQRPISKLCRFPNIV